MKIKKSIGNALRFLAICLAVVYLLFGYRYRVTYNSGESMAPTFLNGEWIFVEKRSYLPEKWVPDKFDVVIIEDDGYKENLSKRVMGVPGDKIEIKEGYIFVNGKKVKNLFGKGRISFFLTDQNDKDLYYWGTKNKVVRYLDQKQETVPEGYVWVIGDDREVSWFGLLPIKNIKGLVIF